MQLGGLVQGFFFVFLVASVLISDPMGGFVWCTTHLRMTLLNIYYVF